MRREIAEGCHVPGRTDQGLKTPRWGAGRRCRVLCFPAIREISRGLLYMRLSALRFPSQGGGKLKAHLARRRENAGPWLFEMVDMKISSDARTCATHLQVSSPGSTGRP